MTKRDTFALMAAEVLLERHPPDQFLDGDALAHIARVAYQFADILTEAGKIEKEKSENGKS